MMIDEDKNDFAQPSEPSTTADRSKAVEGSEPELTKTVFPVGGKDTQSGVDVQSYIGRQLRAVYDDVAKQPIPERFLALMKQLEEQTSKK